MFMQGRSNRMKLFVCLFFITYIVICISGESSESSSASETIDETDNDGRMPFVMVHKSGKYLLIFLNLLTF